jgi:hypothetical protein
MDDFEGFLCIAEALFYHADLGWRFLGMHKIYSKPAIDAYLCLTKYE